MTDVGLGDAQPQKAKRDKQKRRAPLTEAQEELARQLNVAEAAGIPERAGAAQPIDSRTGEEVIPDDWQGFPVEKQPANPYAPTGWRKKNRVQFDLELPSGQLCLITRLERDDLLRLNLMQYLDTFTPMLLGNTATDEQNAADMTEIIQRNPQALQKLLTAIDKVVMACTLKPQITEDKSKVNYGDEDDWRNPDFVATVLLDDIDSFERMFIFGAAFGRDMDDLKSVLEQAEGLGSLSG